MQTKASGTVISPWPDQEYISLLVGSSSNYMFASHSYYATNGAWGVIVQGQRNNPWELNYRTGLEISGAYAGLNRLQNDGNSTRHCMVEVYSANPQAVAIMRELLAGRIPTELSDHGATAYIAKIREWFYKLKRQVTIHPMEADNPAHKPIHDLAIIALRAAPTRIQRLGNQWIIEALQTAFT